MSVRWSVLVFASILGLTAAASGVSCSSGSDTSSEKPATCVPGAQVACACPAGASGVQQCAADGKSFGPCQCGDGSGGGGPTLCGNGVVDQSEECDDGNQTNDDACSNVCKKATCGDGIVQAGEDCDDGNSNEFDQCPKDCKLADGGTSDGAGGGGGAGGGSGGAGGDPCLGKLTYAGLVPDEPSVWSSNGLTSKEAGDDMCKQIGADHVCDYEEVKLAISKMELANVATGTTAWVHRTTTEKITMLHPDPNGVDSAPGPGGRCNDWQYGTNHISDGEYVEFTANGPLFWIDNDTVFDPNAPGVHTMPGQLDCGGVLRSILCCYPMCVP